MKQISIILIILIYWFSPFMFCGSESFAAPATDSSFHLVVEAGAGYGISTDTLLRQGTSRTGGSYFLRLLWKPDHLLSIGAETGWQHIADHHSQNVITILGVTDIDAEMFALPLMVVFDMNLWNFDLYTGLGWYYVFANIKAFNDQISTSQWNVGFYLSMSYKILIFNKLKIGPEIKWCSIGELGKTILTAQIGLYYEFFKW
jgi:hypothetical protein